MILVALPTGAYHIGQTIRHNGRTLRISERGASSRSFIATVLSGPLTGALALCLLTDESPILGIPAKA
jgi:hypothetical protein